MSTRRQLNYNNYKSNIRNIWSNSSTTNSSNKRRRCNNPRRSNNTRSDLSWSGCSHFFGCGPYWEKYTWWSGIPWSIPNGAQTIFYKIFNCRLCCNYRFKKEENAYYFKNQQLSSWQWKKITAITTQVTATQEYWATFSPWLELLCQTKSQFRIFKLLCQTSNHAKA